MKITLKQTGGFAFIPGLNAPVTIDTQDIDSEVACELESLVRDSDFFEKSSSTHVARGAADYRTYTLTVQDGSRVHTVKLTDPIADADLERLVSRVKAISRPPEK
ncbi:MAG: protealysin inhibitor emfourin [Nitrososphaerales archaeon]